MKSLAIVALRILAIVWVAMGLQRLIQTFSALPNLYQMASEYDYMDIFWGFLLQQTPFILLYLILAIVIWFKAPALARWMLRGAEEGQAIPDGLERSLQQFAIPMLGLVLLTFSLPQLIGEVAHHILTDKEHVSPTHYVHAVFIPLVKSIVAVLISMLLLIKPKGIMNLLRLLRNVGTSKNE